MKDKNVINRIHFRKRDIQSYVTKWEECPGRSGWGCHLLFVWEWEWWERYCWRPAQHPGPSFLKINHHFYIHYAFNAVITWVDRWGDRSFKKIKYLLQILMALNSGQLTVGSVRQALITMIWHGGGCPPMHVPKENERSQQGLQMLPQPTALGSDEPECQVRPGLSDQAHSSTDSRAQIRNTHRRLRWDQPQKSKLSRLKVMIQWLWYTQNN